MNALVDTTAWSLLLRRPADRLSEPEREVARLCRALVTEGRAYTTGIVRQEVLSGIRDAATFEHVLRALRDLPSIEPTPADHEAAARLFNRCRAAGIAGTAVDMLICALALREGMGVLTTDGDFRQYARVLAIDLLGP